MRTMVKPPAVSTTLLTAVAFAATAWTNVQAFQPSRPAALSPPGPRSRPLDAGASASSSIHTAVDISSKHGNGNRSPNLHMARTDRIENSPRRSLFGLGQARQRTRLTLQRLRRSVTVVLASLAFFLSSTRVHVAPAHASSSAAAATTSSSLTLSQRLNPFRLRSADEMIDDYVRDRLFADDEFDPVESAYREACADYAAGKEGTGGEAMGAYPTLLAETAGSALGKKASVSSVLSSSTSSSSALGAASSEKKDGITATVIKMSDFLQSKLRVSASVSYYILAGVGLFTVMTLPPMLGIAYQGIQRAQIDKGEMKMYGKISDISATSKKGGDDDDDDDDDEEE